MKFRSRHDLLSEVVNANRLDHVADLAQPVQHQPLQLRHVEGRLVMRERAEHQRRCCAAAIALDVGLEDLLADPEVVGGDRLCTDAGCQRRTLITSCRDT